MKFLDYVSRDLLSHGLQNIKNYTLVFPMHRAGLFMKEAIRDEIIRSHHNPPVLLPEMLTLDELITDLSGMRSEDELSAVCLLYQLCRKYAGDDFRMSLDVFYGWGRQLLTDFSNIEMLCLSDEENARLLRLSSDAEQLDRTDFSEEERRMFYELVGRSIEDMHADCNIRATYLALWGHLPEIFADFGQKQMEAHVGSRGALTRFVCRNFRSEEIQRKVCGKKYIFVGFNYLLRGERSIMQLLKEQSLFYWDDCNDFHANKQAFEQVKKNINEFGQALNADPDWQEQLAWKKSKPVKVVSSASLGAQAQYVNKWLTDIYPKLSAEEQSAIEADPMRKAAYEKDFLAKGTTAIVLADEHMLESVVYALPGHISGRVNVTKGYPLRDTPVFAALMAKLSDSSLKELAPEDALSAVEEFLSKQEQEERLSSDATWRRQLKREALYQVRLVITRMRRILANPELRPLITDVKVLRCLMRRHLESVSLPFHGSPLTPIQVIGVLETRLLDFDHLLVLNCEEGTLPNRSADLSFLPFYIRKLNGMQTRTEDAEIFAYNFFRLLRRAADVTLLFSESSGKKAMSRFLMQILTSPCEFAPEYAVLTESYSVDGLPLEAVEKEAPRSYIESYRRREAQRAAQGKASQPLKLSPSAINAYLSCPRSFYLQNVLGVREAVVPNRMLRANDIGTIIHGAVEHVYRDISHNRFPYTVQPEEIRSYMADTAKIETAISAGYDSANDNYFLHNREIPRLPENIPYIRANHPGEDFIIREFLLRILRHDADGPLFTLRGMELQRYAKLTVKDEEGNDVQVLTGGSIDRLDEICEEDSGRPSLRILDYKTGKYEKNKLSAADMEDVFSGKKDYILQTLVYCLSCVPDHGQGSEDIKLDPALPVMPELLYPSQLRGSDFDPHLSVGGEPVRDFVADQRDAFVGLLTDKVQEIVFQTDFPMCEEGKCKSYCPFFDLCGRTKPSF